MAPENSEEAGGTDVLFVFHIPKTAGQSLRHMFLHSLDFHREYVHLGPFGFIETRKRSLPVLEDRDPNSLSAVRVVHGHDLRIAHAALFPERRIALAICLREPSARLVSQYDHFMFRERAAGRRARGFWDWYEDALDAPTLRTLESQSWAALSDHDVTAMSQRRHLSSYGHNYMCKFVATILGRWEWFALDDEALFQETSTALSTFQFVGTVERFDELRNQIAHRTGIGAQSQHVNRRVRSFGALNADDRHRLKRLNQADYRLFDWAQRQNH